MAEPTLLMRLEAEKAAGVDQAFQSLLAGSQNVQGSFSATVAQADALNAVLAKLVGTAEKVANSFEKVKASKSAISEAAKEAQQLQDAFGAPGSSATYGQQAKPSPVDWSKLGRPQGGGWEDKTMQASVEATKRLAAEQAAAVKATTDAIKAAEVEKQKALKATQAAFDSNIDKAKELGPAIAVGLTADAATLVALGKSVLETANSFEQMQAQLTTVTGSAAVAEQTFERAKKFAAASPFDLEGVVKATVQIEAYGQSSEKVLPRAAALAAGMGKSLTDTALVVGKAMSGSLEGFESLRNEYGITTRELVRFGAETNKAGGILVQTAEQAKKARDALMTIIDLRFGDAVARQAATLSGQIEKLKDEVVVFSADVGKGAAEVVKFGAAFVGGGLEMLNKIPADIKAAAGAALVLSAGFTTAAVGAGVLGGAFFALLPRLVAAKAAFVAMGGAQGALFIMEQHFNALGLSAIPKFAAALAGPVAALAALAAVVGVVTLATNSYIDAQVKLQSEMREETAAFQQKIKTLRDLANATREVAGAEATRLRLQPQQQSGASTSESRVENLKKVLDAASASDFFEQFKAANLDAEQVRTELEKLPSAIEVSTAKVKQFQDELLIAKKYADSTREDAFGNRLTRDPRDVERDLQAAQQELKANKELEKSLELVNKKYEESALALGKIAQAAKGAEDYLRYADKVGGISAMSAALDVLKGKVSLAAKELRKLNMPTDRDSLLELLRSGKLQAPGNEQLLEQVKSYLDGLDDVAKREKDITKERIDQGKQRIQKLQEELALEQSLRKVSAREELAILAKQEDEAKKLGEAGVAERIRINQQKAAANQRIRDFDLGQQKKSLEKELEAKAKVDVSSKAADKGTKEAVEAYDEAIKRTEAWIKENDALISTFSDIGTKANSALDGLRISRAQAETARLAKNFDSLKDSIRAIQDEAVTTSEKLEAIGRAKDLVTTARGSKTISADQATDTTTALESQRTELERQKRAEDLQHKQQMTALAQQAAEQELAIAQTLADGSIRSNDKILVATERLYQFKLEAIAQERDAAIAAGQDKQQAEERYDATVRNLEKQREADFLAASKARVDTKRAELQQIIDLNKPAEDATKTGLTFGLSDSASFFSIGGGTADEDAKRRNRKRAEKELKALDTQEAFKAANPALAAKMAAEDREKALRAADPSKILRNVDRVNKETQENAKATAVTNNQTNIVNVYNEKKTGRTVKAAGTEDVVREVRAELNRSSFWNGGPGESSAFV